ncbi:unnamed protein product, partial [Medioppia subpectinata]
QSMAESSAANRVNAQSVVTSETNPSIFEVLAQQSLADGLRRAANYLINILYTNNTEKFDFWYKNFDEIYLLADICVQFCHLKAFNASFAEHFYSLKRISADKTRHRVLNGRQVLTSLALLTAFPYIKAKFDSLYARLKLRELESQTTDQLNRQRLFVRAYPTILTFCRLLSLYYEISYAVDRNPYHSPLVRLAGVRLINLEDTDFKAPTDQLMYISLILYTNNTEKFDFWYKNFDEIYLLADICVQFCHLKAFNASFAEHFYSLKRISADKIRHRVLNGRQVLTSLALLTAFPYIKAKFDSLYARLKLRELESQTTDQLNRQQLFVRAYPTILTFCRLLSLYYEISYAVDRNPYHSPLVRLAGVRLINLEDTDFKAPTDQLMSAIEAPRDLFSRFARLSVTATKCLATGFAAGLSVSAFFIQFLDYWYSTDMYAHSFAPLPIPPAPPKIEIDIPVEKCPICLNVRQNDTALMTSGFVFCYAFAVRSLAIRRPPISSSNSIHPTPDRILPFIGLSVTATKCLATGFAAGLSVSAFFIQFLDYWYSTDMYAHSFAPLPIPPAPPKIEIDIPVEKCPICLNVRQNDTALMTSGFVFCYACIINHLKVNSRCPVTGYPTATDQLIKLYPPDA